MADLREELAREVLRFIQHPERDNCMDCADALIPIIARHVEAAVNEEREACAQVADNAADVECCGAPRIVQTGEDEFREECCGSPNVSPWYPDQIAAAIRARGQGEIVARDAEGGA